MAQSHILSSRHWTAVDRASPWCAAFSPEDVRVLVYREDIGCYYYCGPGRRINELLGCPPLRDMIDHFRNLERTYPGTDEPKGIFYFSHTVTLQATMAAMGIGKDSPPLLSTNYRLQKNRCSDVRNAIQSYMIYVSEKLWMFDGCTDGVCDWEWMKQKFGNAADECNLGFCYNS